MVSALHSLTALHRRIVKRWPGELVLTDGKILELWHETDKRDGKALLGFDGKVYAYARPLRARELWYPGSENSGSEL